MESGWLWPDCRWELIYQRACIRHRGLYALGPLRLEGADPWGLFPFVKEVPYFSQLLVYPKAGQLALFRVLGDGTLFKVGEEILLRAGDSVECRGVRDFRHGDTLRHVHWPTTARLGRLVAKEFEEDVVTEVTIVLDLRRIALSGLGDHSTLEYAVKAAAMVAHTAIEQAHLVQLWAIGAARRSRIPFGGGREHLYTILDALALAHAEGRGSYDKGFIELLPTLRPGSTLVFIISATAFDWTQMHQVLRTLAAEHIRLIAVVIEDRSFIPLFAPQDELRRRAMPTAELAARLRAIGVEVYTVADRDDVARRLEVPA